MQLGAQEGQNSPLRAHTSPPSSLVPPLRTPLPLSRRQPSPGRASEGSGGPGCPFKRPQHRVSRAPALPPFFHPSLPPSLPPCLPPSLPFRSAAARGAAGAGPRWAAAGSLRSLAASLRLQSRAGEAAAGPRGAPAPPGSGRARRPAPGGQHNSREEEETGKGAGGKEERERESTTRGLAGGGRSGGLPRAAALSSGAGTAAAGGGWVGGDIYLLSPTLSLLLCPPPL